MDDLTGRGEDAPRDSGNVLAATSYQRIVNGT